MSQIKGTSVVKLVRVFRKNRELAMTLIPERLHNYLTDRILPSSWYPEADYIALLLPFGKMLSPTVKGDVWEWIGERGAEEDVAGIYTGLVRKEDPWGTLTSCAKMWHLYRDAGRMEVKREGPGRSSVFVYEYAFAGREVCSTMTGYFRKLLELAGATGIDVSMIHARLPARGPCEWVAQIAVE
jgi:hypothetical protein